MTRCDHTERQVVEEITSGVLGVFEALGDARAARLPVLVLVEAVPGLGPVRAAELLEAAQVPAWVRAGELGPLRTERLAAALGVWLARRREPDEVLA